MRVQIVVISHDRKDPKVVSIEQLWRIGDWFERETYDMFGIEYTGHRDLRRILFWEAKCTNLESLYEQLIADTTKKMASILQCTDSAYFPVYAFHGNDRRFNSAHFRRLPD